MRAAVFQCAGGGLSSNDRLQRLGDVINGRQLDLVVCPELFMSGYDVGDDLPHFAEPQNGPFSGKISELAKRQNIAIVYGYPEQDGDVLYNSALCISADGSIVANHRKMVLPPGFEAKFFVNGNQMTIFDLGNVRCALLVCYDVEYPESVRAAAEAGAQVVMVPTALFDQWGVVAHKLVPTRAFENGVWLLYANHAGSENQTNYLGYSCIVAPDGTDAARAGPGEALIAAEIDIRKVAEAQERLPYLRQVVQLRKTIRRLV